MKAAIKHRIADAVLMAVTLAVLVVGLLLVGLLWPYDDVRFPGGNVGTVEPQTIRPGGNITVTWPSYCNDGRATYVERYADVLVDGEPVAAFELPALMFPAPDGPVCVEPTVQTVTIPNYVVGPGNRPTQFRLRNEIQYKPNPIRTVTVVAVTEPFTIRP